PYPSPSINALTRSSTAERGKFLAASAHQSRRPLVRAGHFPVALSTIFHRHLSRLEYRCQQLERSVRVDRQHQPLDRIHDEIETYPHLPAERMPVLILRRNGKPSNPASERIHRLGEVIRHDEGAHLLTNGP